MENEATNVLLVLVLVAAVANLVLAFLSWWRHDGLAARVTRIEANQANALTAHDTRRIYERLSNIEGQLITSAQLMHTIQKHLLEHDE